MINLSFHIRRSGKAWIGLMSIVFGWFAIAPVAMGQETPNEASRNDATLVHPFVTETTFLIVKVDPRQLELPDMQEVLDSPSPEAKGAYRELSQNLKAGHDKLRELADDQPVYATVGIPRSMKRVPVYFIVKKTSNQQAIKLERFLRNQLDAEVKVRDNYVVAAPNGGLDEEDSLASRPANRQHSVATAFQSVSEFPVQILIVPPDHVWRTVRELSRELPPQLGGGPSSVLTEGMQWAALGIDPGRLRAELIVNAASADAARDFAAHLPVMLRSAYDAAPPEFHKRIPADLAQQLVDWLKPQTEGNRAEVRIDGLKKTQANLALLSSLAALIETKTRRRTNRNRLKQIMLAVHNYYDTHQMMPPADKHRDDEGKYHLSWRVHILPYVGEEELYRQFRLDEPWDSPHNKELIAKMPEVYASNSFDMPPNDKLPAGHTTFLAPVGEKTIFGGAKAIRFRQILDGTSHTIAVVEATPEEAVPWTAPDDYQFDPAKPLDGVLIGDDGQWLAAFADGSVRQLHGDISAKTALHLFQMSDGNSIPSDVLR